MYLAFTKERKGVSAPPSLSADTVQDPKFYDAYKKALDESDMRTEAVLNTIQAVFENLFSIFGIQTVWQSTARMRIEKMAGYQEVLTLI